MMLRDELIKKIKSLGYPKPIVWAFGNVNRMNFIPIDSQSYSWEDRPLLIGYEQTISQPTCIASMLEYLDLKNTQQIEKLKSELKSGDVLLTLGAGDIYKFGEKLLDELVKS